MVRGAGIPESLHSQRRFYDQDAFPAFHADPAIWRRNDTPATASAVGIKLGAQGLLGGVARRVKFLDLPPPSHGREAHDGIGARVLGDRRDPSLDRPRLAANGARTPPGAIERLGIPDEDGHRSELRNQAHERSHSSGSRASTIRLRARKVDETFLENCEWRDNRLLSKHSTGVTMHKEFLTGVRPRHECGGRIPLGLLLALFLALAQVAPIAFGQEDQPPRSRKASRSPSFLRRWKARSVSESTTKRGSSSVFSPAKPRRRISW